MYRSSVEYRFFLYKLFSVNLNIVLSFIRFRFTSNWPFLVLVFSVFPIAPVAHRSMTDYLENSRRTKRYDNNNLWLIVYY